MVVTGRDVLHVRDGESRVLLDARRRDRASTTSATAPGRLGLRRRAAVHAVQRARQPVPGEIWRIPVRGRRRRPSRAACCGRTGSASLPTARSAYGSDYARSCVLAWDVAADGSLSSPRVFAEMPAGSADGMAVDEEGGVWVATGEGGKRGALHAGRLARPHAGRPGAVRVEPLLRRRRHARRLRHDRRRQAAPRPGRTCRGCRSRRRACSQPGPQQRRHTLRFLERPGARSRAARATLPVRDRGPAAGLVGTRARGHGSRGCRPRRSACAVANGSPPRR